MGSHVLQVECRSSRTERFCVPTDFASTLCIRPAIPIDPKLADLAVAKFRENRANALLTLGRYSEALDEFDSALKIDSGNPEFYLGRGRAHLFLQNSDTSIEDFKIPVRLRPLNPYPVIWLHIARLHAHDRDDDEFAANAARVKRDAWPSIVVDLYLGTSNGEQIVSAALATKDDTGKHACEADFFVGDYVSIGVQI